MRLGVVILVFIHFLIPKLTVVHGGVYLPHIFGDDMVMQTNYNYGQRSYIWGTADPNETVTVTRNPKNDVYTTKAGEDKTWKVMFLETHLGVKQDIIVSGESGPNITLHRVLWGNVLLCSGQSNMVRSVSYIWNATAVIAEADHYPNIRLFQVHSGGNTTPQFDLQGSWLINSAKTVPSFSAVCYMTALWMSRYYWGDSPIGLIYSAVGGTPIQAWMSASAVKKCNNTAVPLSADTGGGAAPQTPSVLYNGMIHPVVGMTVRAVLWYQGERNVPQGRDLYRCNLAELIQSWRDAWRIGDFAWLNVQLAPYHHPREDVSAVRLAQTDVLPRVGGKLDTVGTAIIIDLGDPKGLLHPHNKTEVGRRMALQLLHVALAWQNVTFSGPKLVSALLSSTGDVILAFNYSQGMYLNDTHFCETVEGCCNNYSAVQVSADNQTWTGADASLVIKDDTVTIPHETGITIKFVRLDISNFPGCALFNSDGLPAAPFIVKVDAEKKEEIQMADAFKDDTLEHARLGANETTKKPPMGFNSWFFYGFNIDEITVMNTADAMVTKGLSAAGYVYVNIDNGWVGGRTADGSMYPDPVRFPSGMKYLANYIHSKGLKFGIYIDNESSPQSLPGSGGHELQDAATFCEWGIDLLKMDGRIKNLHPKPDESWTLFKQGLDNCHEQTGRDIVLSIAFCASPTGCGQYIAELATMWRTTKDIEGSWESILSNLDNNDDMSSLASVGHYNDPDLLMIDNIGVSQTEGKSQFFLWNIIMAPLLIGADVTSMPQETVDILTAPEVLQIANDTLGQQGVRVFPQASNSSEVRNVWARHLLDKSVAVALLNRGTGIANITVTWDMIGVPTDHTCSVRDVWRMKDLGTYHGQYTEQVASHDVSIIRVTPSA